MQLLGDPGLGAGRSPPDPEAPAVRRGELVQVADPELPPQGGGALGADAFEARDRREALGDPLAQLGEGGDVAGLGQLDDLRLERVADVGEFDGAALHRHSATDPVSPDPRGAAPVGQHAVADGPLHLEQVAEQLQALGDLAVRRQSPGARGGV